jgi:hypothetical protein
MAALDGMEIEDQKTLHSRLWLMWNEEEAMLESKKERVTSGSESASE